MANEIKCPRCGSPSVTANKKGFSAGKAIAGDLIAGPIGLLAGGMGSGKIIITCLNCGHKFKPGDSQRMEGIRKFQELEAKESKGILTQDEQSLLKRSRERHEKQKNSNLIAGIVFIVIFLLLIKACN